MHIFILVYEYCMNLIVAIQRNKSSLCVCLWVMPECRLENYFTDLVINM